MLVGLLTAVQAVTLSSPPPGLSGYSTRFDAGGALASIRRSSAAAVAAALSDGKELLEIEFPPLIESKGQFDDFSNVEVLDANRDFGVQLALEPEIQAPAARDSDAHSTATRIELSSGSVSCGGEDLSRPKRPPPMSPLRPEQVRPAPDAPLHLCRRRRPRRSCGSASRTRARRSSRARLGRAPCGEAPTTHAGAALGAFSEPSCRRHVRRGEHD